MNSPAVSPYICSFISALIKDARPYTLSVLKRCIDRKLLTIDSIEEIAYTEVDNDNFDYLHYLILLNRNGKLSKRVLSEIDNTESNIDPSIYMDIPSFTPRDEQDIYDILSCLSNSILSNLTESQITISNKELFSILCYTLNVEGARVMITKGYKPIYSSFDALIDVSEEVVSIYSNLLSPNDKVSDIKSVALDTVSDMIILFEEHGYECDNRQKSKLIKLIPSLNDKLHSVESTPQWSRECKVTLGKPSKRLRSLALDIGIDDEEASKSYICSAISEYSKRSLNDIIEDGDRAMSENGIDKPFRVLPYNTSLPLEPRYQVCSNSIDESKYTSRGIIKYKGYCIPEEEFSNVLKERRVPNTDIRVSNDVLSKINRRLHDMNKYGGKGRVSNVSKSIIGNTSEEKYRREQESRFIRLLQQRGITIDDMSREEIMRLSEFTLGDNTIDNIRSYIDAYYDLDEDDEELVLSRIEEYMLLE